ncbi:MAG TPA: serine hydrolase domain-containing protein [Sphingomicrobium sp.]|nr:serine hydrolase domain-containing protein [Sphingomicrobium sp.]
MKTFHKLAIGASVLALGSLVVATGLAPDEGLKGPAPVIARLSAVAPEARQAIDYDRLDARLKRLMERPTMVGLAVGIVENGRITFLKGYGETLAGSNDPVTPETVFRWASLSKGVASTMVVKLAEEGKVDLDAPIARYRTTLRLPDRAEHRATVGDLLSHRLGIYRNAYDDKLEAGEDPRAIRQEHGGLSLICQPGTCWSYGNIAYDAASEIVQDRTGKPYGQAVRQRLFDPLGMDSASVSRRGLMSAPSWARPHNAGRREVELTEAYYRVPAAGGVNSNIKDLALWLLAQVGEAPAIVSPNVLAAVHAPLVKTPRQRARLRKFLERLGTAWYGYGWRSYDYAGHRLVGHRGGVNGYRSLILFDPRKKSGVVALWNSNTSQPGGLEFEVMDMIHGLEFRDWLGVERGSPATGADEEEEESDIGEGSK